MNIEFEKHIIELLKNNQCVTLPNFGGFILKSVASTIHQNTIYPPSKQIAFNSSLQHDDELLTGALMGAYNLDYSTAKNKVLNYSNSVSYTLRKERHIHLKQIGSFSVNDKDQIVFKPFINELLDKGAFGFNSLHIKKISKPVIPSSTKKPSKTKVVKLAQKKRKETTRKLSKAPLVGLVSSVLLFTGILGLMVSNTHFGDAQTQRAGFVDMFFPTDNFVSSFENTYDLASDIAVFPTDQKEGYLTGKVTRIEQENISDGYYIVVGSYASISNAERMESQLFAQGKDSYIIPTGNGFYRVCTFASKNLLSAQELLKASAQENQGAWLIKNQSSI